MFLFNFHYLMYVAPAILLALWAQWRVKSTYAEASHVPAGMTGAQAARRVLDAAGLHSVRIEQIPGELSDHYDSTDKVLRLSPEVYGRASIASVGIAAHEAGHALQDAERYAPMSIRQAAVPVANFGSGAGMWIIFAGMVFGSAPLLLVGIVLFSGMVFFQLVNLPVEFNASARAKAQLVHLGIIHPRELDWVNRVLDAAAWTYVAGTLHSVLTLLYYLSLFSGSSSDRDWHESSN
jgi:Zn-dependent membrane protease YugP